MSVLQSWLEEIPIRMQSTLILGLRGPDTGNCPEIKKITRWMRGLAFKPGNPDNVAQFMGEMPPRIVEKSAVDKELSYCTMHVWSHLLHSLEVVGYRHPDAMTRIRSHNLYLDMCELMHLAPEPMEKFEERLKTRDWPGGVQPDTFKDAMEAIR